MIYVLLVLAAVAMSIFCGIQMDRHHWRGFFREMPPGDEAPRPMLLAILLRRMGRPPATGVDNPEKKPLG
jgi:hypothetical protein